MSFTDTKKLKTDIGWYILGSALPMLTLFVRSPIYTRIYSPHLYGLYTLVFISFTYVSAIGFQWITNNAWRYYLKYKRTNNLEIYWSIIISLYILIGVIFIIGCFIWQMQADDLLLKKLIIMGGVYVFTNELFNTLLVPTRLEGKANYYNTLNSIRAALSFMLLIAFTFIGNHQIEAFFFAPLTVNLGMILFLIKKPLQYFRIFPSTFFLRHSMRFIKFGSGNLLYNVGIFLLVSSDRYIIALFESNSTVGIYNQTYNIGQITITALFTIILAALNPVVIPSLEKNPLKSNNLLYSGLYSVFYLVTPFVLMGSFFSYEITVLLLGESFREAWQIIPVILLSTLFAGCNHFAVVKLKFLNKLNALFLSALGASIINIGLNLLLIPIWGYKIAAFTTLVSYVGLLIALFKLADLNPIENKNIRKNFLRILVALLLISLIHYTTKGFAIYKDNLVINAIIKSIIYIIVFYLLTHRYFPFNEEANKQTNI